MSNAVKYANVYLDNAAGTEVDPRVLSAMLPYYGKEYRNPSSMHRGGRKAHQALESARSCIARSINAFPEEILFTSSGTESDNLALRGIAHAYKTKGNHIIISAVEHKAVIETARALEKEGFRITLLPVDRSGLVSVETLLSHLDEETILVSLIYANNELGSINNMHELANALTLHKKDGFPLLHTDACQALGYLAIDVKELPIDLMTFNSAKLYGPTGVAALYKKKELRLVPLFSGGEQEQLLRPGTEPLPLIMGFAKAIEITAAKRTQESERLARLRTYFIHELHMALPDIRINGHPSRVLPNIVHVTIPGVEGEAMLLHLDEYGISVSTGSACSAFDLRPSHVLSAIGQKSDLIHGSIRFSFGRDTTEKQLAYTISAFKEVVHRLQNISAVTTHAYEMQH